MKQISKLQYITQDVADKAHWQLVEHACKAGVQWIQLRMKNRSYAEFLEAAIKSVAICRLYNCKLIINDNVEVAMACKADGVHLGKTDMDTATARKILGNDVIIGGTANTFDDIERLANSGVDYIGLGPYRFTHTKENLSPILGLQGYEQTMNRCVAKNITTPVIAIGGIHKEDVSKILNTGVYGVAVASSIGLSKDINQVVADFVELLN